MKRLTEPRRRATERGKYPDEVLVKAALDGTVDPAWKAEIFRDLISEMAEVLKYSAEYFEANIGDPDMDPYIKPRLKKIRVVVAKY